MTERTCRHETDRCETCGEAGFGIRHQHHAPPCQRKHGCIERDCHPFRPALCGERLVMSIYGGIKATGERVGPVRTWRCPVHGEVLD